MTASNTPAIRVAIIGGGCSAMATAFELSRPEHEGRYKITVYQQGWRLGGKGASGRGPADRIEEHGLHLWMGFYENAFRLMRECYTELARDPARCRIASWTDAFVPDPRVGVMDRKGEQAWDAWVAEFPPAGPGLPGDPLGAAHPFTVRAYLVRAASLIAALVKAAAASEAPDRATPDIGAQAALDALSRALRYGKLATTAGLLEATQLLQIALGVLGPRTARLFLRFIDAMSEAVTRRLQRIVAGDLELQRTWQVVELVLACVRGTIRFGLVWDPRGFDAINDYDWRDWLKLNGASPAALDSGFMRGIYDLVFAYEGGDVHRPSLAAGVALRGAMRMFFTYRGALFWKMTSGMGDVVFAPLYEVLIRRGVRFEFFHRVRSLKIADGARREDPAHVAALEIDVQAEILAGGDYQPLIDVRGLPCWPANPRWSQLVDGEHLAQTGPNFECHREAHTVRQLQLKVGRDFDAVVLATGMGAVEPITRELAQRSSRWREMLDNVKTVPTQALQLWMQPDLAQLGWTRGSVTVSGFVEPFDTWADMGHLATEESWPRTPGSIAYFCSVLPEDIEPARAHARVRQHAIEFLQRDVRHLWPHAVDANDEFRWDLLCCADPRAEDSPANIDGQYWTANVSPSERFTLSLPGSLIFRISPLDVICDNLTIAGDWTQSGLDSGCVESAVMSGLLAAHALATQPPLKSIIGYDHP